MPLPICLNNSEKVLLKNKRTDIGLEDKAEAGSGGPIPGHVQLFSDFFCSSG